MHSTVTVLGVLLSDHEVRGTHACRVLLRSVMHYYIGILFSYQLIRKQYSGVVVHDYKQYSHLW